MSEKAFDDALDLDIAHGRELDFALTAAAKHIGSKSFRSLKALATEIAHQVWNPYNWGGPKYVRSMVMLALSDSKILEQMGVASIHQGSRLDRLLRRSTTRLELIQPTETEVQPLNNQPLVETKE